MNTELQNLAWKSLPKESREKIRDIVKTSGMGIHGMFDLVFGGNVTSDVEPDKVFIIEQKKVQKTYSNFKNKLKKLKSKGIPKTPRREHDCALSDISFVYGAIATLTLIFGDECFKVDN